ncbi:MAG TPA: S-methyl-5'-thioadenosine phosphorylase [Deltaproteobacteria bacterium]|nr:S-methyl-5'-thioadenosine phosphorylase [Deltaproteobacteria bacterium]
MKSPQIAIIGGSGLYEMAGLKILEERAVETPFGEPSDDFLIGELEGIPVAFLARHARGHRILPTELNFRANIYAIKKLGCEYILSVSAVGSLKEEIEPRHLVMIDQFIDRTTQRPSTFFGDGVVAHVAFAEPICPVLRAKLHEAAAASGAISHPTGTYVCIEGPMFSTKAESRLYRSWNADVIGMTNLQEARLAREAELCYATMALSTDYDCWHEGHDHVTAEMVLATLTQNVKTAQEVIRKILPKIAGERNCPCHQALRNAIFTNKLLIPESTKQKIKLFLGKIFDS